VLGVQMDPGDSAFTLDTTESDEIIETIARAVIDKGAGLLEISSAKADLEEIFLKLTYGDSAAKTQEVQA